MYAPCNIYWHKWENSTKKYHLSLWSFENWSKTRCAEPSKVWKTSSNLCPTAGPGIEHPRLRDSDNRTARLILFYPSFKDFTLSCTLQHANRYTLISCTYTHQYEVEQCQHWIFIHSFILCNLHKKHRKMAWSQNYVAITGLYGAFHSGIDVWQ